MAKLKVERVAGIVALSYLVIIPVGAFLAWQRIESIDKDVNALWDHAGMETTQENRPVTTRGVRSILGRWNVA